jgi:hypothetical protein
VDFVESCECLCLFTLCCIGFCIGLWSRCIVDGCVDVDEVMRKGSIRKRYEGEEL